MRTAHRSASQPWDLGIALAMILLVGLVLAVLLNFRVTPLAAETASPSPPAPQPKPTLLPDTTPQFFPSLSPALPPAPMTTADIRLYQGRQFRYVQTLTLRVTAYAPDRRCTFPYPGTTTASGLPVTTNGGHLVAADTDLIPLHSLVVVPGYAAGKPVPVLDRGSAVQGHRLDVLLPTFTQAQSWGVRTLQVKVYKPLTTDH